MSWDEFTYWARRLAESVDVNAHERTWRLECASLLAEARSLLLAGSSEWVDALVRGLRKSDLHFILVDNLRKVGGTSPDDLGAALLTVWDAEPEPAVLDDLDEALATVLGRVTPGNSIALGSHLLLAMSPGLFPPYAAEFVAEWSRRVGMPDLGNARPSERYQRLLELCDALLGACGRVGVTLGDRLDARGLAYWVIRGPAPADWTQEDRVRLSGFRGEARSKGEGRGAGRSPDMEAAAWVVLGSGLRSEPSPFDPTVTSWTPENARDAVARIADAPDTGGASFMVKLQGQLESAPRGVVLLVSELLYLHALPLTNVSPDTKRKRVATALGWLPDAPRVPGRLDEGFDAPGSFNGGTGFNVQIWLQLVWLLRMVERWTSMSTARRQAALAQPDAFAAELQQVRPDSPGIRHCLKYLAWPGWFESIVNTAHRKAIRNAFAYRIGGPTGADDAAIDRDLRAIRQVLDVEAGSRVDYYASPYKEQWQKGDVVEGTRAWLVRPKPNGSATLGRWKSEGFVSLVAQYLGEVPPGSDLTEVRAAVERGYQHLDYAQRLALAGEYHAFLSGMKTDDYVAAVVDDRLHVGLITGEADYVTDPDARLRRRVHWTVPSTPLAELAPPLPGLLDQQGTVVDVTAALAEVQRLAGVDGEEGGDGNPPPPPPPPKPAIPVLPSATDELAASMHLSHAWLQEMVDLLQVRQQIVFYGPPGTGKTHVARELARHLVGADDPSRSRLVQFHPSYAYEDFFEGFRPTEGGTFVLTPGPLRDLAAAALAAPGEPFVLIIDEMNRANLAKVFGELYFLLEYRDQAIRLQYRPTEAFRLPSNLFLIGTMNTADRSIALVDAAIRRRFAFVELHPDVEPVRDLLPNFLAANKRAAEPLVEVLRALNAQIEDLDRDLRIGPTYLMRSDVVRPGGLERVWRYDLLPLLEEHYYGRCTREEIHRRFGLEALLSVVSGAPGSVADDDGVGPAGEPGAGESGAGADGG